MENEFKHEITLKFCGGCGECESCLEGIRFQQMLFNSGKPFLIMNGYAELPNGDLLSPNAEKPEDYDEWNEVAKSFAEYQKQRINLIAGQVEHNIEVKKLIAP